MKKATKFILAAMLGLAALMTTACALDIVAPENKWVEYEYPYEAANGNTYVTRCYAYYTETQKEVKVTGKDPIVLQPGLTIVVTPKIVSGSDQQGFLELFGTAVTEKSYVMKTFKNKETVDISDEKNSSDNKSFKMGYTAWMILYNSIIHEGVSSSAPIIVRDGVPLSTESFKWKKLMYWMAINKLTQLAEAD